MDVYTFFLLPLAQEMEMPWQRTRSLSGPVHVNHIKFPSSTYKTIRSALIPLWLIHGHYWNPDAGFVGTPHSVMSVTSLLCYY